MWFLTSQEKKVIKGRQSGHLGQTLWRSKEEDREMNIGFYNMLVTSDLDQNSN